MLLPTGKNKRWRIALLGIYHESNTFVSTPTTLQDFQNSRWLKGQLLIENYRQAFHELGGALEVFSNVEAEILPVFYAETTPGGEITAATYDALVQEMFRELDAVLPVDACFVVPHGAAVAQHHPDMDGDWLCLLREKLGEDIPIVGTLDPHANVSPRMVGCTQGLFPYSTNPHIDQRETGGKAAAFLIDILKGVINPHHELWQAPLAISIEQQYTEAEPCKSLYRFVKDLEVSYKGLQLHIVLGFPYADVPEMGTSVIILNDNEEENTAAVKQQLQTYFLHHKEQFSGKKDSVEELLAQVQESPKPVLLLDMGDNVGGGSAGDSTYLLEKLDTTPYRSFLCLYAPEAVSDCCQLQVGQSTCLSFGTNPETGQVYCTTATLLGLYDGKFTEAKPRHGGQQTFDMGRTAIVRTEKQQTVLLHSKRMPPFSLAQITSCQIDPTAFDVIVAKGVNAPIAAYKDVCPTLLQVNTPGTTQADMTKFTYQRRRKPLFPFEDVPA